MLRGLRPWQRFAVTSSSLRPQLPVAAMSTSASNLNNGLGSFSVSCPPGLSKEDLSRFPAFRVWFATLQRSLSRQKDPSHEFHKDPYLLRKIEVQAVDFFQGGRLGFVKLRAEISNAGGESLPGSVFLRGGSVGMLVRSRTPTTPFESVAFPSDCATNSFSFNRTMFLPLKRTINGQSLRYNHAYPLAHLRSRRSQQEC
jgi:hypothetical protein